MAQQKIKLNACQSHCCPELYMNVDGSVTLTDDYGGSVRMTRDEVVFAGQYLLTLETPSIHLAENCKGAESHP